MKFFGWAGAAIFALLLACRIAAADPAPQTLVRAHLEPAGPVVAGSQVKLVVDLLTTTFFTDAPNWPLFTVPDAIVSLPDEQAVNLSEDIGGVHWFGVSRAYRIAPQAGKVYDIPSFAITVFPGGMNGPVQVSTPALKLATTLPPGAEGMRPFFPAPKLTVTQKIEPADGRLRVGDALTRTITQSAAGTESMFIPPVDFGDVEGLKRYGKPSASRNIVQDRVGLVAGERTDSATYSAERSGRFRLPPITIQWWNTSTQKKETVVLPAVTFSAAAAREKALFEIPVDAMRRGASHRIIVIHGTQLALAAGVLLCLLAIVGARARVGAWLRRVREAVSAARKRYRDSDTAAWRELRRVGRAGEWRRTIPALYRWLDKSGGFGRPALLDEIDRSDDAGVRRLVDTVALHYASDKGARIQWREAEEGLQRAARRAKTRQADSPGLAPLNDG